jgi:MFS family permease
MQTFLFICFGQLISLVGSGLTSFALGVWVYQTTGSVTQFALISLFIHLPNIIISPVVGAIVDRWDRRWAMILSDSVAGIGTLAIWMLLFCDRLEIWHIYVAVGFNSIFNAFQWPAYSATIGLLVHKQHLARANGAVQISRATAKILSPALAGVLVAIIHLEGILAIDFATFLVALAIMLMVRFPQPEKTTKKSAKWRDLSRDLSQEIVSGWNYITFRPGLRGLLTFFTVVYFTMGILEVLFWPLMLNFSSSQELGMVLSIGGFGWLLGSITMSAWGGPRRKISGIYFFVPFQGLLLCLGVFNSSVALAGLAVFGFLFAYPIVISCNQTIWQTKVPVDLQGRVFALQQAVEKSASILAYIITGPIVDRIFEPLLLSDGLLAGTIGRAIGIGPGRGSAFFLILMGLINILATFIAYQNRQIRRVEVMVRDPILSASNSTDSSSDKTLCESGSKD